MATTRVRRRESGGGASNGTREANDAPGPPVPVMPAPASGVNVRMYRQGLGDCFLLAFPGQEGRPFYMLIDCGVIVGQKDRPRIPEIAEHIAQSTNGRIDLLVVTHEHWDHLSGFIDAAETFKGMTIGRVWLPWTENTTDDLARDLREGKKRTERALHATAARLGAATLGRHDSNWKSAFDNVLGFLGANGRTTQDALDVIKQLGPAKPEFCYPTDPVRSLAGVNGVQVYVLGPPHDEQKIKRHSDRKTDPQTYRAAALGLDALAEFLAVASDADVTDEVTALKYPFDPRHRVQDDSGRTKTRFDELNERYFGTGQEWRRIDHDWMRASSSLALHLDNATNNTSLALAIELEPGGKVLLFPGDAQVGNWLSWHDQTWKDAAGQEVSAESLLRRTVLYKVGHHCSHNATLRQRGLELMVHPDLVALSPLDRKTAKNKDWPMPWPSLRRGLVAATKGRILQVDDRTLPEGRPCPKQTDPAEWERFQKSVRGDDTYFELTIA